MNSLVLHSSSEADTVRIGHALAELLPAGTLVLLVGPLGAGKTRLVQAIAEGLGIDARDVTSPTFVLVQEYHGTRPIYHLDMYRLSDDDEFWQLGVDELLEQDALVLVEWADRVQHLLPPERLEIRLTPLEETSRRLELSATDYRLAACLGNLRERLATNVTE